MTDFQNPWDTIFTQTGKVFTEPHEDMPRILSLLKAHASGTILDLGCGSGRHSVYFTRHGFTVFGIDHSPAGIAIALQWLEAEGLAATLSVHDIRGPLPFETAFFDAVISTQVIHHATLATIKSIVGEIRRVLKDNGLVFVTMPGIRNQGTRFEEIEPDTFVPLDGVEQGLPHHYFTTDSLRDVFRDFNILDIHLDAAAHYCLTALK